MNAQIASAIADIDTKKLFAMSKLDFENSIHGMDIRVRWELRDEFEDTQFREQQRRYSEDPRTIAEFEDMAKWQAEGLEVSYDHDDPSLWPLDASVSHGRKLGNYEFIARRGG